MSECIVALDFFSLKGAVVAVTVVAPVETFKKIILLVSYHYFFLGFDYF